MTFKIPENLSPEGEQAARAIVDLMSRSQYDHIGGKVTFYSPEEFPNSSGIDEDRAILVVKYADGDRAFFFRPANYRFLFQLRAMADVLRDVGAYSQQISQNASVIYPLEASGAASGAPRYPRYKFYVVHRGTGVVVAGADYREDARDFQNDLPLPPEMFKILTQTGVMREQGVKSPSDIEWGSRSTLPEMFPSR